MEPIVALTKTTSDGRAAIVTMTPTETRVTVDGKDFGGGGGPYESLPPVGKFPAGAVARIGRVALTQPEADELRRQWDELAPLRPRDLRGERSMLVAAVRGAENQWHYGHSRRMDSGEYADPFAPDAANEAAIEEASCALAAFDAEHPEIVAAIKRELDERTQRAMWQ